MPGLAVDYAQANSAALANFFVKKFNLVGRDAEWDISRQTLRYLPKDNERLKSNDGFYEAVKVARAHAGGPGWGTGNTYHFVNSSFRWQVQKPYAQYARMTFDNLMLARTPTGTLLDLQESESQDVKDGMLNVLEFEIWNDGTGLRGTMSAITGSDPDFIVTLSNPAAVWNFQHNMVIQGGPSATGSGIVTATAGRYRVTGLLPEQGQIAITRLNVTGTTHDIDTTTDKYLFAYGSGTNYMPGIPTFIPSSDPADTLLGVPRTGDPATSGWRFAFKNSMSYTIQYAFTQMGKFVKRENKSYVVVLSPMDWLALSQEREGRVFDDPAAEMKWGVAGLAVRTPFGQITCITIDAVVDGRGYIMDWSSWCLYTLGNLPHIAMESGNVFERLGFDEPVVAAGTAEGIAGPIRNGDGIYCQLRIWKILLCKRPMSNATFVTGTI